jgi:hypothetical protein
MKVVGPKTPAAYIAMEETMTLRKILLMAAVVLSVPVVPALAHDDEDYGYTSHDRFHDQLDDAHERAHEYGFYSRGEHRAYHRALRDIHNEGHGYLRYYYYSRPHYYGYGYGYRGW